jgi:microcin C transport system permease protein
MGAYLIRRILLMIPTLLGIMIVNFTLVQFVPGGPIEHIISQIEESSSATDRITGGGQEVAQGSQSAYQGSKGLPEDYIKKLEKEFGFVFHYDVEVS